jgi:hypothetical protein
LIVAGFAAAMLGAVASAAAQPPAPGKVQPPAAKAQAAHPAAPKGPPKSYDKPLWRDLSAQQQAALEPLSGEWDQMEGVRKRKWLEMAAKFASMKPEEQQRMRERMREWVRLTPAQRNLARENYNRIRKIAPTRSQKAATWQSYQQLPEDEKKKLAAQASGRKRAAANAARKSTSRIHSSAAACPTGTVKNTQSATPPCVPAPAAPPVAPVVPAPVEPAPAPATPGADGPVAQPSPAPPAADADS